jgi:hypothetical protein
MTANEYLDRRNERRHFPPPHGRRRVRIRQVVPGQNLRQFMNDSQNVHTAALINTQQPILDALFKPYSRLHGFPYLRDAMEIYANVLRPQPAKQTTFLSRMKQHFFSCFMLQEKDELERYVDRYVDIYDTYTMNTHYMNGDTVAVTYTCIFTVVLMRISHAKSQYQQALLSRLMEELRDSTNVCSHGKITRLLNVFSGFEEVVLGIPPVDLSEKLGNAFAALREKNEAPEKMRESGLEILLQYGVTNATDQNVWLDAL